MESNLQGLQSSVKYYESVIRSMISTSAGTAALVS
jgi:hypothetical protein